MKYQFDRNTANRIIKLMLDCPVTDISSNGSVISFAATGVPAMQVMNLTVVENDCIININGEYISFEHFSFLDQFRLERAVRKIKLAFKERKIDWHVRRAEKSLNRVMTMLDS